MTTRPLRMLAVCAGAGLWFGTMAVAVAQTAAPFRVYMRVTNGDGTLIGSSVSSGDPLYPDWSGLYGFGGGGAGANAATGSAYATLIPMTVTRAVDGVTPPLFQILTTGKAPPVAGNPNASTTVNINFVVVRSGPDRLESWKIACGNVFVTDQSFKGGSGGSIWVEVDTLRCQTLEWSYLDTDATGRALAEIYASYDQSTHQVGGGTRGPNYPGGRDTDGDGIPDGYEYYYHLDPTNLADAALDPDGDGQSNLMEYIAATDPTDGRSVLRVTAVSQVAPAGAPTMVTVTWQSVAKRVYTVESAAGPSGPWTTVATVTSAGDTTTQTTVNTSGSPPRFFYRVTTRR